MVTSKQVRIRTKNTKIKNPNTGKWKKKKKKKKKEKKNIIVLENVFRNLLCWTSNNITMMNQFDQKEKKKE